MFGHVRGAFTDARADRKGRFEVANGGTIFLDEIGDLDPPSQVKMLRVLQDRTFEVLGSSQRREVDVRVVSATNRPLTDLVARGEFREDLLYRINLMAIHLPPLRERPDDIPVLAARFLQTRRAGLRARTAHASATPARGWLQAQPWPGNVRQLRQWVERAVLVSTRDRLEVEDFIESVEPARGAAPAADALPPVGSMTMDEIERAMIVKSLRHHGGNVSKVAESLGLSRAALYRRFVEVPRSPCEPPRARDRLPRRSPPDFRRPRRLPVRRQPVLAARRRSHLRGVARRRRAAVARDVSPARDRRRGIAADSRRGVHVAVPCGGPA